MKKFCIVMLAFLLTLSVALTAAAEGDALDAFRQLTGEDAAGVQSATTSMTHEQYLDEVMAGAYSIAFANADGAQRIAPALDDLCAITAQDIAAYAAARGLSVAQVRNAYYRALANVLRAEIMVNPASEERYRNVQVILSLFLDPDDDPANESSRDAIRHSMTPEHAATIAADYNLPTGFVEFIIMDDDWNDDDWENDGDWEDFIDDTWAWGSTGASLDAGSRDGAASTRVAELQERLIALGYLTGKADGIFGERTQAALREFQLANGLRPTGSYTGSDASRLFADDAVARWDYAGSFYDTDDDDYYDGLYDDTGDDSYENTGDDWSGGYDDTGDDSYENTGDDWSGGYDDTGDDSYENTGDDWSGGYDDTGDDSYENTGNDWSGGYDDTGDDSYENTGDDWSGGYDDTGDDSYENTGDDWSGGYDDTGDDSYENTGDDWSGGYDDTGDDDDD